MFRGGCVVSSSLLVLIFLTAIPCAQTLPREALFVPWGDDPLTEVRYQAEPGCNYGPQSFRIDAATGMISILDPLNTSVKYFRNGVLEGKAGAPREARDFAIESGSAYVFLSGNQLARGLVESSGISGIVAGSEKYEAIKLSSNMARISVGGNVGSAYLTIDVPVTSGNLGCLRIVGVDGIGRIFVDVDLVERAVPLKVRREVWIVDRSGRTLGKIGIPTHYFTRIFRDLELDANGDLYHMISSEDGIHIMKWTVPDSGGFFEGEYPSEFRRELHYNYLVTDGSSDSDDRIELAPQGTLADTVTRAQALAKADTYVQHLWTATAANISNGVVMTPDGDSVRTPDWIVVGQNQKVPYKFGGTDELVSFDSKVAAGLYAGDNHTDGSSNYATGVDCSGFVCRCWQTDQDYSTYRMVDPAYGPPTLPYATWDQIQPGDAVHKLGHVRMAVATLQSGILLTVESAGSSTGWRVDYSSYTLSELAGYSPRYYIHMEGIPTTVTMETAASGSWTSTSTWVGGAVPTSMDDVLIKSGHTVSVDDANAACKSVYFGGNNALIDMNANAMLTVYGDFTLYGTTHVVFSAGWSATNARIKFAGDALQTLSGWNAAGGSTSFRDVIIDKTGGKVTTDGSDMRLGIQNSLEIVNGLFELAAQDDIEGRFASSGNFTNSSLPNVTIRAGGELYLVDGDGAHHVRSGTGIAIGTVTVYGKATFRDASTYRINLSGVNIEDGGKVLTSTEMGGGEFNCGPLVIKSGGEVENYTTSDCWSATSSMTIQAGGMFDTKASTTIFPATLTNNGTVRYSRDETTDQTIVDMNYNRLEISLSPTSFKNWTLGASRVISDSLKINYDANLVLTAASARTLTVGNMLHLSSGAIDNSDPDVSLVISDGVLIKRVTGSLAAAPVFAGMVDLIYASTSTNVTTGPEMPAGAGVLNDLTLTGDEGMTLGADVTVNGTCAATGSDIFTGAYTLTLGPTAVLTENDGRDGHRDRDDDADRGAVGERESSAVSGSS